MTLLELIFSLAILSAFVAVYVAWSSAALRYSRAVETESSRIAVDRAMDWVIRDIQDRVPESMFDGPEDDEDAMDAQVSDLMEEGGETLGEGEDDDATGSSDDEESPADWEGEEEADDLSLSDFRQVELITPHAAPGEAPGFYYVRYHLRDGSLWRRSRPMEGKARRLIVTRSGSFSGDDMECLRNVTRFDIEPVDERHVRLGMTITLEMELDDGKRITRSRFIRGYP